MTKREIYSMIRKNGMNLSPYYTKAHIVNEFKRVVNGECKSPNQKWVDCANEYFRNTLQSERNKKLKKLGL